MEKEKTITYFAFSTLWMEKGGSYKVSSLYPTIEEYETNNFAFYSFLKGCLEQTLLKKNSALFSFLFSSIDPLHCSLLRMRDKAMSALVAIKQSSYYRNEWQITRKPSFFRITTAKFLYK